MAPELPGTHGLVNAGVEEMAAVVGPGEAVVHVVKLVGHGALADQGSNGDVVSLVTFKIGAHGHPGIVWTHAEYAH